MLARDTLHCLPCLAGYSAWRLEWRTGWGQSCPKALPRRMWTETHHGFKEPKWHMFRTELWKERHTTYYFMVLIMRVLVPMLENSKLKLETPYFWTATCTAEPVRLGAYVFTIFRYGFPVSPCQLRELEELCAKAEELEKLKADGFAPTWKGTKVTN